MRLSIPPTVIARLVWRICALVVASAGLRIPADAVRRPFCPAGLSQPRTSKALSAPFDPERLIGLLPAPQAWEQGHDTRHPLRWHRRFQDASGRSYPSRWQILALQHWTGGARRADAAPGQTGAVGHRARSLGRL